MSVSKSLEVMQMTERSVQLKKKIKYRVDWTEEMEFDTIVFHCIRGLNPQNYNIIQTKNKGFVLKQIPCSQRSDNNCYIRQDIQSPTGRHKPHLVETQEVLTPSG